MRCFFDENFSPALVRGLAQIESRDAEFMVASSVDALYRGAPDEELIPFVAEQKGILVSQDLNMRRTKHLNELLKRYRLGVFFFSFPSGTNYWGIVQQVIRRWPELKKLAKVGATHRPYAYRVTVRGGFQRL